MKTNSFLLLLIVFSIFISCKKLQDSKITFYVPNAGDAGKWGAISVEIAGKSGGFMTPERRNMALGDCSESPNSVTFILPPGTYPYTANNGQWKGSITVDHGDCSLVLLKY